MMILDWYIAASAAFVFTIAVGLPFGLALQGCGFHTAARYVWNILVSLDQLGNVLLGGDPDETISSRAAKRQHLFVYRWLAWLLEWIDPGHMERHREDDEGNDAITQA